MSQHHFADGGGRVSRASRKSSAAAAVHRSASRRSVAGGGGSRTRLDARSADPRDDSLNEEDSEDENWAEVNVAS